MARPRQVSDAEILDAARACFLKHGPSVSTTVIADQVGLSQAALFKRFGTKERLMFAALAPSERVAWIPAVEQGPDDRSIHTQLVEIATRINAFLRELMPCLAVLRSSGLSKERVMAHYKDPPPLQAHRALSGWLRRAADAGRIRDCDTDTVALMLMGSLHTRSFLAQAVGDRLPVHDDSAYVHSLVDTLWSGMAPLPVQAVDA